ncbi:hypothetical protein N9M10_01465 [Hellea sp.]|nr:hypothetical protein [Hellea sp.]
MFAVLLLIGAARAYDNGGILDYGSFSLDLNKNIGNNRLIYTVTTATFIVLSIIVSVGNKLILTNIGRRFFEESLSKMRDRILTNVNTGQSFNRGDTLKILNRDCRYLSLSYLRVLTLLQPALFLIGIFSVAVIFVPVAALLLGLAGLVALPFNIYLVLWAARTSQDIQDSAKVKSAEEKDFIAKVSTHPFIHELNEDEFINDTRPGQDSFLTAFVKRQRMGAFSQSITDFMMALVIVALALFLFFGGGNTLLLNLSNLVILVILFRFMTGYISQLAQAVTMISSYEPFFRTLLDLDDQALLSNYIPQKPISIVTPIRLALFQNQDTDWSDTGTLKSIFSMSEKLHFVTSTYEINVEQVKQFAGQDEATLSALPTVAQTEISAFLNGEAQDLSLGVKLILAVSHYKSQDMCGLLLNGKDLVSLGREELRYIMAAPEDRPLLIVYRNAPRNLVLPPRFQIVVNAGKTVDVLGNIPDFLKLRDDIIAKLSATANESSDKEDIFGYELS